MAWDAGNGRSGLTPTRKRLCWLKGVRMNMALTKEDLEKNRAEIEALESTLHSFATGLGFGEDEAIYLRLLTPKGFDPKNAEHRAAFPKLCYEKAGRWLASSKNLVLRGRKLFWVKANGEEKSVSTDPVAYLRLQNQRGYAPYIVVNPGGANKSSIAEARVIFWEADNPKPKRGTVGAVSATFRQMGRRDGSRDQKLNPQLHQA
jgi:hypothetical protein